MFWRWARFRLRKYFKPIPAAYAQQRKHQLTKIYAFAAWNLFGLTVYSFIRKNYPPTEEEEKDTSRWFIRLLQLENVKRHSMSGFSVQMVDYIKEPGELIVDGQVVVKKKELNEAIYSKLE
ncbi:Protein of unknown function [Cotesia congregata]|uniref:Uncharacterized protein n=1 Tax=Cotesia congregata TaxID=51543 RepID=A0A8J2HNT8_COTCN|nr:Protein of unknown function [Cotesia congregata]